MKLKEQSEYRTIVAYLYDPIPLEKVGLDQLKKIFPNIQAETSSQFIFGESSEQNLRLQMLTARLDLIYEGETGFSQQGEAVLTTLLDAAPPINLRGLGVTIFRRVLIEHNEKDAGIYTSKYFLSNFAEREKALAANIIAGMHRITYGEAASYFDFRISPQGIGSEKVQLQLRKHKDVDLRDRDKIIKETLDGEIAARTEFDR